MAKIRWIFFFYEYFKQKLRKESGPFPRDWFRFNWTRTGRDKDKERFLEFLSRSHDSLVGRGNEQRSIPRNIKILRNVIRRASILSAIGEWMPLTVAVFEFQSPLLFRHGYPTLFRSLTSPIWCNIIQCKEEEKSSSYYKKKESRVSVSKQVPKIHFSIISLKKIHEITISSFGWIANASRIKIPR